MKIIVLCNSEQLAFPAIVQLQQQGMLAAVGVTKKSEKIILPLLLSIGIPESTIHVFSKDKFEQQLHHLILEKDANAVFVLTFPWMLPTTLLQLPAYGCINFHFGRLPNYKGGDPIFWQIKNMEKNGAISIHQMTPQLDEGPLLIRQEMPIIPGETYGLHCQRLGMLAVELVNKLIDQLQSNTWRAIDVSAEQQAMCNALTEDDLTVKWDTQTADEIEFLVNATNPRYGGAITSIKQSRLKLYEVAPVDVNTNEKFAPGTIVHADATYGLIVACLHGAFLKINVVSIPQGFISGIKLFQFGFSLGEKFV